MKLLDTDICIGLLKAVPKVVAAWRACDERCALSLMSVGELAYGAAKARNPEAERSRVERLVRILDEGSLTKQSTRRIILSFYKKSICSLF